MTHEALMLLLEDRARVSIVYCGKVNQAQSNHPVRISYIS